MGFLKSIFGGNKTEENKEEKQIPWIALTAMGQLEEIVQNSSVRPQVIFKHSTTCGVSRMVLNMFKQNYQLSEVQMDFHYLDLHANRNISDEVAIKFQVTHQSPQLLIIKNGRVVVHDSHGSIADINLEKYV